MTIFKQVPLSELLWYKIGGVCKYLLECRTKEDILEAFEFIRKNNVQKYLVVGLGANLLVSDSYFDGAVIQITRDPQNPQITKNDDGTISVFGGELLDDLIQFCFQNSLTGLEWAGGLPSTIGGAVLGNVGAFGHEVQENFVCAEVFDTKTNTASVLSKKEINFSYRSSLLKAQKNLIILSATFQFQTAESNQLKAAKKTYSQNIEYRERNHPVEYPNCGSVFKNIIDKVGVQKILEVYPDLQENVETKWHGKVSTAALITKLGFSGYRIGNAKVYEKHANFIINLGGAHFDDVVSIIHMVQETFTQTFGFTPELEAEIVS